MDVDPYNAAGNAFDIPDFYLASSLSHLVDAGDESLFQPLQLDISSIKLENPYAPASQLSKDLRLPQLDSFDFGPLPSIEEDYGLDHLDSESFELPDSKLEDLRDDLWIPLAEITSQVAADKLLSWQTFFHPDKHEPNAPNCLSEASPLVFDAALVKQAELSENRIKAGTPVQPVALLRSLWQLGLGRSSVLFPLDRNTDVFRPAFEDIRASGTSLQLSRTLIQEFYDGGCGMRSLRTFVDSTYKTQNVLPARVGLATAVNAILTGVEGHGGSSSHLARTFLQLQALYVPVKELIQELEDMIAVTKSCVSNEKVIEAVFSNIQSRDQDRPALLAILLATLARVAQPWLINLEHSVGLRHDWSIQGDSKTTFGLIDHDFDASKQAAFLSEDDARLIFETSRCLTFMKQFHPEHGLLTPRSDVPSLKWAFDWNGIESFHVAAFRYEQSTNTSIKQGLQASGEIDLSEQASPIPETWNAFQKFDECVNYSKALMDTFPVSNAYEFPEEIHHLVMHFLSHDRQQEKDQTDLEISVFPPPLALTPSLSISPLIRVQHALLAQATVQSLMHKHNLRAHFDLHHEFSLFSSGIFASRLNSVLFSPDVESAERHRGVIRTGGGNMGLKLGSGNRRDWPPASSELQLALMNILGDSWREEVAMQAHHNRLYGYNGLAKKDEESDSLEETSASIRPAIVLKSEIPGGLSFSIRTDLPESTISKILDTSSIAALDFLRLSYNPPAALTMFFTVPMLDEYDRIFALWLRLSRVNFVLGETWRDIRLLQKYDNIANKNTRTAPQTARIAQSFFVLAQHFFTTLASHFRLAGIEAPWRTFMTHVEAATAATSSPIIETPSPENSRAITLATLISLHSETMVTMTSRLFLRKPYRHISQILEELCNGVLHFSALLHAHVQSVPGTNELLKQMKHVTVRRRGGSRSKADDNEDDPVIWKELAKTRTRFEEQCGSFKEALKALSNEDHAIVVTGRTNIKHKRMSNETEQQLLKELIEKLAGDNQWGL